MNPLLSATCQSGRSVSSNIRMIRSFRCSRNHSETGISNSCLNRLRKADPDMQQARANSSLVVFPGT